MTGEQETESEVLVINEGEVKTLEEGDNVDESEDKIPRSVTPPCISIPDTIPASEPGLHIQMSTFEYQGNI